MKNLKNIFTVALIATCMSGCTGFLDIEPETTLTGKNFYKSPDDIRSALYSTYSSLRDNGLYSASIYLFGDVRSDVAFPIKLITMPILSDMKLKNLPYLPTIVETKTIGLITTKES